MNDDTISSQEAINAVLRNLNKEEYRSSWESGAVKVMKDTLEKMPTEDRPVNGVLFKGRLEEGNYNLIKTTDGWVLKGKTSYVGFNFADRLQGKWIKFGLGRGTRILFCTNCERRIEVPLSQGDSNYDYCPNCGAYMKGVDDE